MAKKISTPHDRYFKSLMTRRKISREFFEKHLPKNIKDNVDLNTLNLEPNSFIDDKLKLQIADLLYSANFKGEKGYIYILIEHQSYQDKLMPFRIIKYMIAIMEHHLKKAKSKKLPIIYPLIFYSGAKPYSYSTNLFDLFGDQKNLPNKYCVDRVN